MDSISIRGQRDREREKEREREREREREMGGLTVTVRLYAGWRFVEQSLESRSCLG
jgi:hypothetical protein